MKRIVDSGVKLFWIGIPTIPQNDGNRKRRGIDWNFYASKNDFAKKAVQGVGGLFIDIAPSTEARKQADGKRLMMFTPNFIHVLIPSTHIHLFTIL